MCDLKQPSIISLDFVDQEYRQGSAGRFISFVWSMWRSLRKLQLGDGLATGSKMASLMSGTLVEMAGRPGSAGAADQSRPHPRSDGCCNSWGRPRAPEKMLQGS